jgi:hypothetical protein
MTDQEAKAVLASLGDRSRREGTGMSLGPLALEFTCSRPAT